MKPVALFTRAWIEIQALATALGPQEVALFTRAWIEIMEYRLAFKDYVRRPLHEGVD